MQKHERSDGIFSVIDGDNSIGNPDSSVTFDSCAYGRLPELIIFEMWDVYSVMLASWHKVSFLNTTALHHINWLCRFMNGFENTVSCHSFNIYAHEQRN